MIASADSGSYPFPVLLDDSAVLLCSCEGGVRKEAEFRGLPEAVRTNPQSQDGRGTHK
jgi:hypothetical protein